MAEEAYDQFEVAHHTTAAGGSVVSITLTVDRLELDQAQNLSDLIFSSPVGAAPRIVLDIGAAAYINSTAVSLLVRISGARELRVVGATPSVRKVLDSIGILPLLDLHDSVASAIASF